MATPYRRRGGLAALLAGTAIALAACSGSSSPTAAGSPTVASLGTSTSSSASSTPAGGGSSSTTSGGSSTTTTTGGGGYSTAPGADQATQLLIQWTDCMRSHDDPNQADPVIDVYGVINIAMQDVSQSLSHQVEGGGGPCANYLSAASNVLRAANPVAPPPDNTEYLKYVDCMRANGVSNYPDPVGDKTDFNGTGINLNSPLFENANKVCGKQIGAPAWWISGTGPPGDVSVTSTGPGAGRNGPPPSGAVPVQGGSAGSGGNG